MRGTYKTYRQVLNTLHKTEDVPESEMKEAEHGMEEGAEVQEAAAEAPSAVHPTPTPAAAQAPMDFTTFAMGQLVWGEQVCSFVGLTELLCACCQGRSVWCVSGVGVS